MRLAIATVFAFFLTGCAGGLPGFQTLGIDQDPDKATKTVIVAATLVVDAVAIYGALPPCDKTVSQPLGCRKAKAYADAKLIAQSTSAAFQGLRTGNRSAVILSAALIYAQWQIAKTVADSPGPTDPDAAPTPQAVAYIEALGLADVLVNSADKRIADAASVNVTVGALLDALDAKVAALP